MNFLPKNILVKSKKDARCKFYLTTWIRSNGQEPVVE